MMRVLCTMAVATAPPCTLPLDPSTPPMDRPWVATGTGTSTAAFRARTEPERLAAHSGHETVLLSSANAFSYGRTGQRLAAYLADVASPGVSDAWAAADGNRSAADGLFYWFGEHSGGWVDEMLSGGYDPTPLVSRLPWSALPAREPALSFGVGGHLSGVPFHVHGAGFSETLHGAKAWFFSRHAPSHWLPNATSAYWLRSVLPGLSAGAREALDTCTLYPGQAVFFPEGWYHATVNMPGPGRAAVFVSAFL